MADLTDTAASGDAPVTANRRRRGVLGGLVVMAVGLTFLLVAFHVSNAVSYLFVALGLAFAAAYITSLNPYVYLIPSTTLLGLGLGLLIPDFFRDRMSDNPELAGVVYLGSLALGFAIAYVIRPQRKWPLLPAGLLGAVALAELFTPSTIVPPAVQPFFVPLVLIAIGAYLVVGPRAG
jgi:hypothetical protein